MPKFIGPPLPVAGSRKRYPAGSRPGKLFPSHGTLSGSSISGDVGAKRQAEGDKLSRFKNAGPVVKAAGRL